MTYRKPIFVVPLPATVAAGSELPGHPASNLMRFEAPGLTWQGVNGGFIRGQLPAATPIDFAAIMAANATSDTTVRLRLGASQGEVDGGSAPYDSGAQPFPSPGFTSPSGLYHSFQEAPAPVTANWWRIDIGGFTGTFEASIAVVGKKIELGRFMDYDFEFGNEPAGELKILPNGVVDRTRGVNPRTLDLMFNWMTEAEWENQVRPAIEALSVTEPVYCCFDATENAWRQNRTLFGPFRKSPFARGRRKPGVFTSEFKLISLL